jgi:hypothetical protein
LPANLVFALTKGKCTVWLTRLVLWCFGREIAVLEALFKASRRRDEQRYLEELEADGVDVSAARTLLAALDAEDAPKPIAPPIAPAVAPPPALPSPTAKRRPGRPRKAAAPGAPFQNGSPR